MNSKNILEAIKTSDFNQFLQDFPKGSVPNSRRFRAEYMALYKHLNLSEEQLTDKQFVAYVTNLQNIWITHIVNNYPELAFALMDSLLTQLEGKYHE